MTYISPEPFDWRFCGNCGRELIITHDGQSDRPHCIVCRRFYYRNPVPATCCFVRRAPDELLYARRAVHPCKGEWTLPGGFLELGETTEEGALRELLEETNLRATRARLLGVSTRQSLISGAIVMVGYIIDDWEGEEGMRPDTDAMELRFFRKHERPRLPFPVHQDLLDVYDLLDDTKF